MTHARVIQEPELADLCWILGDRLLPDQEALTRLLRAVATNVRKRSVCFAESDIERRLWASVADRLERAMPDAWEEATG